MHLPFTKTKNYSLFDSIDIVQNKINELLNRRWHDFENNLHGKELSANKFILYHKWSIGLFSRYSPNASVKITIVDTGTKTIVKAKYIPNWLLSLILFILVIWFIGALTDRWSIETAMTFKVVFFLIFLSIILALIKFSIYSLKKSLERFLGIP